MLRKLSIIGVTVLIVLALTATGATAVSGWSNAKLTVEVKRLKAQNHRQAVALSALRGDVRNLYADIGFLQLYITCNVAVVPGSPAAAGEAPGDRDDACAQLAALNY